MQINQRSWNEDALQEWAAVAKQSHPLMRDREPEQIIAALDAIQERHPADFILEAREGRRLLGWLSFGKTTATMGEMGRWQPHVRDIPGRETFFRGLLRSLADEAIRQGIRRIEVGYGRVSEKVLDVFHERAAWLTAEGFHKLEDNLYMACTLSGHDLSIPPLPEGISVQRLSSLEADELFRCYRRSFSESEHRQFFDFTPGQIREAFDGEFDLSIPFNDDASLALVDHGDVIGFSLVRPRPEEAHLAMFGLHPGHRGRGLGTALLLRTMQSVHTQGTERITLGVDAVNVPAVKLYEKLGFALVSRMVVHSWKSDA